VYFNHYFFQIVFAGKLAAEVIAERAAQVKSSKQMKPISQKIYTRSATAIPIAPIGLMEEEGDDASSAVIYGGGIGQSVK
jgi:hypothetical protein